MLVTISLWCDPSVLMDTFLTPISDSDEMKNPIDDRGPHKTEKLEKQ